MSEHPNGTQINQRIAQLFALVAEAIAGATHALLANDTDRAKAIVEADHQIDDLVNAVGAAVWQQISEKSHDIAELHRLVSVLLILPELERSADLAEHIAQRALTGLGREMTPVGRGIVERMSEVATEMWRATADGYADRLTQGVLLDDADTEMDLLRDRLMGEGIGDASSAVAAGQITLLGRFYERLGDHAVNLARRIDTIAELDSAPGT